MHFIAFLWALKGRILDVCICHKGEIYTQRFGFWVWLAYIWRVMHLLRGMFDLSICFATLFSLVLLVLLSPSLFQKNQDVFFLDCVELLPMYLGPSFLLLSCIALLTMSLGTKVCSFWVDFFFSFSQLLVTRISLYLFCFSFISLCYCWKCTHQRENWDDMVVMCLLYISWMMSNCQGKMIKLIWLNWWLRLDRRTTKLAVRILHDMLIISLGDQTIIN